MRKVKIKLFCLKSFKNIGLFKKIVGPAIKHIKQFRHLEMCYGPCLIYLLEQCCNNIESIELLYGEEMEEKDLEVLYSKISGLKRLDQREQSNDQKNFGITQYQADLECYKDSELFISFLSNKLTEIDISDYGLTSNGLAEIAQKCPQLQKLNVVSDISEVLDDDIVHLSEKCSFLTHFGICSELITDLAVQKLAENCRLLTYLDLDNCENITDKSLAAIAVSCQLLKQLILNECVEITDNGIIAISKSCLHLESIDVSSCINVGNLSILALATNNQRLKSVICDDCRDISDVAVTNLLANCKNLSLLEARGTNVTENVISHCTKDCTSLEMHHWDGDGRGGSIEKSNVKYQHRTLNKINLHFTISANSCLMAAYMAPDLVQLALHYVECLQDKKLMAIIDLCAHKLESVVILGCMELTSESRSYLVKRCKQLIAVDLDRVTDEIMMEIAEHLPQLSSLKLINCNELTDASIIRIAHKCSQLRVFSTTKCYSLTDLSLVQIVKHCPSLHTLKLRHSTLFTSSLLDALEMYSTKLKRLYLEPSSGGLSHQEMLNLSLHILILIELWIFLMMNKNNHCNFH